MLTSVFENSKQLNIVINQSIVRLDICAHFGGKIMKLSLKYVLFKTTAPSEGTHNLTFDLGMKIM